MTHMHRNTTRSSGPFNMRGALTFGIYAAVLCIAGATSGNNSDQHVTDAAAVAGRRSLLREGSGHHHNQQGHGIVAGSAASMMLSQKLVHHLRQGREMMRNLNVFNHDDDKKVIEGQKGYCGSVNPDKDCTGKKNAKNNNNNNSGSGSGDSNGDSGSSDIGVSDVAKAIMSVVKDSGNDKSIDLKKLRNKVQDELEVSSDDSDEFDDFKDKFKDALDKLEDKDLIKIKDGVVSAVISGDDSQDEKKKDKDQDSSGGDDDDDNEKNPDKPSGDDDDDDDGNGDKQNGDSTTDTGKGAIGAECQRNRNCESSMCSDGVCTEVGSGIGGECASDSDCESGICGSEGTCEESRTDDGDDLSLEPTASPTTSEPTSSPTMDDFDSTAPTMSVTSPDDTITDKGVIGDVCEEDGDCESNLCVNSLCSAELKGNGEDCQADTECQSDFCSSAGVCDSISNDTEGVPTPAPVPETNPAPAPAPSASGDDDDDGDGDSRDGPSRPNEVESYSGDLSIPYNFQISTEGGELTPEDIADVEEALGILSQQIAEETFPDGGAGGRRLRQAVKLSGSSRHLLVVYNENDPAEVTDAQQAECVVSTDPGPCYDIDAATTLTLVDEDRGAVREEFRDSMEDAIADGLLDSILREINPDTTLTATVIPSDGPSDGGGQESNVDESREPEGGADATTRSTNLSPGGIAGIAILAAGVTAAVAFAIVAGRRRNNDDDNSMRSDLDSSDDESPRDASALHEDSSLRRLRAAAAAAGSTQRHGVYPDSYHQDAAHMASTRVINPGLQEDEYLSSDDDEPTGAPGSFPTEAPPAPADNASTPLIAAAAVAGGAALAAQHQGIIDESSTDHSMYV